MKLGKLNYHFFFHITMTKATFLEFPHLPDKCSYLNTKYSIVPRNFGQWRPHPVRLIYEKENYRGVVLKES